MNKEIVTLDKLFKKLKAGDQKAITSKAKYEVSEYENIKLEKNTIGGIFHNNIICIDIDNEESFTIFKNLYPNWGSMCRLNTDKGIHFFFRKKPNNKYTKNQVANLYRGTKCAFIGGFTADFLSNIKKGGDYSENNYSLIYDRNNPKRKLIYGDILDLPVELFPLVDKFQKRISFDTNVTENRWDYVNKICKQVYNMKNAWAHYSKEEKTKIINKFAKNLCFILGKTSNIPIFKEEFFNFGKAGTKKREEMDFQEEILSELEGKCTVLQGRVVFINENGELEDYIVSKGRLKANQALILDRLCNNEIGQFPHRTKSLLPGYLLRGGKIILSSKYLEDLEIVDFDIKKHVALTYINVDNDKVDLVKGEEVYNHIILSSASRTVENWGLFWLTLLLPYTPKCAFNLIGKPDLGKTTLVENLRKYIKIGFIRKGDSDRFNAKLEGNVLTVSDDVNLSKAEKRKEKSRNASNVISIERKGMEEVEQLYLANRLVIFNEIINVPWGPQDLIKQKYIFLEDKFDFNLISEENIEHLLGYLLHYFFYNKEKIIEALFQTQSELHWTSIESLLVENSNFLLKVYFKNQKPAYGFDNYENYKLSQGAKYIRMLNKEQKEFVFERMNEAYNEVELDEIVELINTMRK